MEEIQEKLEITEASVADDLGEDLDGQAVSDEEQNIPAGEESEEGPREVADEENEPPELKEVSETEDFQEEPVPGQTDEEEDDGPEMVDMLSRSEDGGDQVAPEIIDMSQEDGPGGYGPELMDMINEQEESVPDDTGGWVLPIAGDHDIDETPGMAEEEPDSEQFDPPPETPAAGQVAVQLADLQCLLEKLEHEFTSKLKYDAHKEAIIDRLHGELQEYKQDMVKKQVLSIVMDLIKVVDDLRKLSKHYKEKDLTEEDLPKLLNALESIPSDLEDLFDWHGVEAFACRENDPFDAKTQRVMDRRVTHDADKDKTVAQSLQPGYTFDGKVIRKEIVMVYQYMEQPEEGLSEEDKATHEQ